MNFTETTSRNDLNACHY